MLLAPLLLASPRTRAEEPPPAGQPAQPAPPAKPAKQALDKVLHGRVLSYDDGVLEMRYDFKDPAEWQDFAPLKPFRLVGKFEHDTTEAGIHLNGTGGIGWKGLLKGKAELEFTFRIRAPRDLGAFLTEKREGDDYTMYSVFDQFFQDKDHPGSAKTHMICRFLPGDKSSGGDLIFRYVDRKPRPELQQGQVLKMRLGKDGTDDWMEIDGNRLAGSEGAWRLLRGLRPGFYVIENECWVTGLVIKGPVDSYWAEGAGIDLSLPVSARPGTPTGTPGGEPSAKDIDAREKIQAFRNGGGSPLSLLKVIEDAGVADPLRADAAAALKEAGKASVVPAAVNLLESQDAKTRTLAYQVVAALTGRDFGYRPDDPEDRRRKAVKGILEYIQKNPAKFE